MFVAPFQRMGLTVLQFFVDVFVFGTAGKDGLQNGQKEAAAQGQPCCQGCCPSPEGFGQDKDDLVQTGVKGPVGLTGEEKTVEGGKKG